MEKEEVKNELLKIKKKYSIKYVLIAKLIEIYIIFFLVIAIAFYSGLVYTAIVSILVLIAIILTVLILSKKSASETYIIFYEDRVFYKRKFLFINRERTLKYSDIKDITITQGTGWYTRVCQKLFNLGNIYIYPKKGNIIMNGISLEVVENINRVIEDMKKTVGDRIE